MEALKKVQKSKLKIFKEKCKQLEEALKDNPPDMDKIDIALNRTIDTAQKLEKADQDVLDKAIASKYTDDQYQAEEDAVEAHNQLREEILHKAYKLKNGAAAQVDTKGNRKLPKLELPKFGGDVREWLPYWSQFEQIDKDPTISDSDKFQYLIQSTMEGSDARELVMSFPVSAANYRLAVQQLHKMYGRDKMLVKVYVRDLLKLVIDNAKDRVPELQNLYFKLSAKIKALETLGVTTDKCASIIYPLVESCLPEEVLRAWQRNPICQAAEEGEDELIKLIEFLEKEVGAENNIRLACTGLKEEQAVGNGRRS